jgi:DNA-binding MarR family transcriptional regulator
MASAVEHLAEQLGRLLVRSNRAVLYDDLTDAVDGVTATTYPVLSGVARIGPTSVTRLAEEIGMDRTVVTRYVTQLEAAGLLTRTPSPDDRRSSAVALSADGARAVQAMRSRLHDALRAATSSWPATDVTALGELLDRLMSGLALPRSR